MQVLMTYKNFTIKQLLGDNKEYGLVAINDTDSRIVKAGQSLDSLLSFIDKFYEDRRGNSDEYTTY